jgi:hypothetical protein
MEYWLSVCQLMTAKTTQASVARAKPMTENRFK